MRSIRLILLSAGLGSMVSLLPRLEAEEPFKRPNFLIVLVDDLRWDELGCAGHPFVKTPHIDRIASEGARFRNAFCTTPLCSPARASLLTGSYMHHHPIVDNTDRSKESHELDTFPRTLRRAGYQTGFVGKWHMGNDDSPRPGFDYWVGLKGQGTSFDPTLNINGERSKHEGHTTDVLNEKAVEFVRLRRDAPFCLVLAHKALHPELVQHNDGSISDPSAAKFLPADRHKTLYAEEPIPRRLNVTDTLKGKPALQRKFEGLPPLSRATGTDDETIRDRLRMLTGIDEGVGQLFEALQQTGQLEDTAFIFLSDHGYWYGEHGLSVERRLAYEEAIRIPFLIRYPRLVPKARLIDEFALGIDLYMTLVDLAGVHVPLPTDGRSLVPILQGKTPENWPTSFVIEYSSDTVFPRIKNMGYQALRTKRWKLIRYLELEGMDELYDLQSDPYEMRNRINDPKAQDVRKKLTMELARYGKP